MITGPPFSRLYRGVVVHTRIKPRRHQLRLHIPMVLVDLDELPRLSNPLLAADRPGLLSVEARHHLSGERRPLKAQVRDRLAEEGIFCDGPVRLLCMPAVLGKVFNPLSVYFCHDGDGGLVAILYEVNNTFGGRHCYVLRAEGAGVVRHGRRKAFPVSPFLGPDLTYTFNVSPPGQRFDLQILVADEAGAIMTASFTGAARPLTTPVLARELCRHPFLMLEVLGGIHWEALKMVMKGFRLLAQSSPATSAPGLDAAGPKWDRSKAAV